MYESATVTDLIPRPNHIRARLSELAAEADLLRGVLRLWEHRECGRALLRRQSGRPTQCQEVSRG
jgi:hypothetical protein